MEKHHLQPHFLRGEIGLCTIRQGSARHLRGRRFEDGPTAGAAGTKTRTANFGGLALGVDFTSSRRKHSGVKAEEELEEV